MAKSKSDEDLQKLADEALQLVARSNEVFVGPKNGAFLEAIEKLAHGLKIASDRLDRLEKRNGK